MPKKKPLAEGQLQCICCGRVRSDREFYKSAYSKVWLLYENKVTICKDCIAKIYQQTEKAYSQRIAMIACCAALDIPYMPDIYQAIIAKGDVFSFGGYIKRLNNVQYRGKCFINSILEEQIDKTERTARDGQEEKRWNEQDVQNKKSVLSIVGYDPFEDSNLSYDERRQAFNIMAGYCSSVDLGEDCHKIQSVIQLTLLHVQANNVDKIINKDLGSDTVPSKDRLKDLVETKKKLLDTITKIAGQNSIASADDPQKKGANTLSGKMIELSRNGYEDIAVNLFDIKTAKAMKQIADLSNQSIMEHMDGNDYADIIREQREMIQQLEEKRLALEEENRILHNEVCDMRKQGKYTNPKFADWWEKGKNK